jgi:hypothetical protein
MGPAAELLDRYDIRTKDIGPLLVEYQQNQKTLHQWYYQIAQMCKNKKYGMEALMSCPDQSAKTPVNRELDVNFNLPPKVATKKQSSVFVAEQLHNIITGENPLTKPSRVVDFMYPQQ